MSRYDLAFIELVGPGISLIDTPVAAWQDDFFGWFRNLYKGTLMANLGFIAGTANELIAEGKANLVSFGAPFIANPDLADRFRNSWPSSEADPSTFYAGGESGYTDYINHTVKNG